MDVSSPGHLTCRFRSHGLSPRLIDTKTSSDYFLDFVPHFTSAYRVTYFGCFIRRSRKFSWGHAQIFLTVSLANTLVRWVGTKRFRGHSARSTISHLWPTDLSLDCSIDYNPVILLIPFGFYLTIDTLSSRPCLASKIISPAFGYQRVVSR